MLRAILCDLDGVIRHWDERDTAAIEQRHGLPAGCILAAAFELVGRATRGEIDDPAWRLDVRDALVRAHGQAADPAVTAWCQLGGRIDAEVMALLAEQRGSGRRIALVSNATTRLEADLASAGIDKAFDAVISSARVRVTKPDPRIFHLAAGRVGCPPDACVFIDDAPANIEGARATGMTGILFAGAADLRAQLAALG
jgi:putative hydrolase of the HAD superfamily